MALGVSVRQRFSSLTTLARKKEYFSLNIDETAGLLRVAESNLQKTESPQSARVESIAKVGHHAGASFDLKKNE